MLVDTFTLRLISSVYRMSELLENNIQLVEDITRKNGDGSYIKRQPLPAMTAAYFLTPSLESVNRFLQDYRDRKAPMYGKCHLFFTSHVSDALVGKIKASSAIKAVSSFKEINIEFILSESSTFILHSPHSLPILFSPDTSPAVADVKLQEHHRLANMLSTLFSALGELPHVRHDDRPVATQVAGILQEKLVTMSKQGSGFPSRIQADHERPTLLLLDRAFDPLSPLVHEFTYQAMVHDLLPVVDDRYHYDYVGQNNKTISKEVLLNNLDPLWGRFSHMHIADLTTILHAEYKQFLQDHKHTADLHNKKSNIDVKQLSEGIKGMPKFQEQAARYSLHIHITAELVRKYNAFSLEAIATLEQAMATGEDAARKQYRSALAELKALLAREDIVTSPEDKMRLLMLYVISQDGIKQDERRQLMELAGILPEDQVAILNLFYLGVTLLQGTAAAKKKRDTKKGDKVLEDSAYDVSRYATPLKRAVEDLLSSGLSLKDFPFASAPPVSPHTPSLPSASGKSQVGSWGKTKSEGSESPSEVPAPGRRLIVVVLGGMSYSELRAMHEVGRAYGREIMVGTTSMLTPRGYLVALKQLKQLDDGSAVGLTPSQKAGQRV